MHKLVCLIFIIFCFVNVVECKQVLPDIVINSTLTIDAAKSGDKGKNYFYCAENHKCSTEDVVKEYFKNKGYNVMRGEVSVWQGLYALAFFDEIFYKHNFLYSSDLPEHFFEDEYLYLSRKKMFDKKYEYLKQSDIYDFINSQLNKYGYLPVRFLHDNEIEGYSDCTAYFYSDTVQKFLKRIDNKIFAKIVYRIAQNPNQNRAGIPDYIVWNYKELVFIEVKRDKETMRTKQIDWAEFLLNNKIPYKLVRVKGVNSI